MPPGAPFNSLALPYNIRVDEFTDVLQTTPQLHLLSHTHSDHLAGLSSKSFGSTVICSRDAKEMLLRHQVYSERDLRNNGLRTEAQRTFSHLKVSSVRLPDGSEDTYNARDLLRTLPLEEPTVIALSKDERITLTLFDANHCPGAVMFLIEGSKGAVLHTGDVRAEPSFITKLKQNRYLKPYLCGASSRKTLKAIYLDTACLLSNNELPSKAQAAEDLVEMLKLYPDNVSFFINAWTWGYEDILKAVAAGFRCKIHVDKYKYSVYMRTSDETLKSILTCNPKETRFHACERFDRCDEVAVDEDYRQGANTSRSGSQIVYINPVTMDVNKWSTYVNTTKELLSRGELTKSLLVGLSRHSSRLELATFVSLFRPENLVPNTLSPELLGYDHLCLHRMFANCLSPPTDLSLRPAIPDLPPAPDAQAAGEDEDVAVLNIIGGNDVSAYARRWADCGGFIKKFRVLKEYLSTSEEKTMRSQLPSILSARLDTEFGSVGKVAKSNGRWDPNDSDHDSDDEKGRTAAFLFGGEMPSFASVSSPQAAYPVPMASDEPSVQRPVTPPNIPNHHLPLTPISSPMFTKKAFGKSTMDSKTTLTPLRTKRPSTSDKPDTPLKPETSSSRPSKRQRTSSSSVPSSAAIENRQTYDDSPGTPMSRKLARNTHSDHHFQPRPSIFGEEIDKSSRERSKRQEREERRAKRLERANIIAERMSQSSAALIAASSNCPTQSSTSTSGFVSAPITRESTWTDDSSRRVHFEPSASTSGSRILGSALRRLRCTSSANLQAKLRG